MAERNPAMPDAVKKVVLAYSGGLDTRPAAGSPLFSVSGRSRIGDRHPALAAGDFLGDRHLYR